MRTFLSYFVVGFFCLLSAGSFAIGQQEQKQAKPDSLEALQAAALKQNADMKVAEAKVRLAEANLEHARMHLKAKVAAAYADVQAHLAGEEEAKARVERARKLVDRGNIPREDYDATVLTYVKLKNERVAIQARLQALIGDPLPSKATPAKEPIPEKNP